MLPRVTPQSLTSRVIRHANQHASRLAQLNEQLSTGLRVNRPSDDPVAARSILTQRGQVGRSEAHLSNVNDARSRVNHGVSHLLSAKDVLVRARELAVEARQSDDRGLLSREVDLLFDQLLQIANQTADGEHLFAGADTATKPFQVATLADGQTAVTYFGATRPGLTSVGVSLNAVTSFDGERIFLASDRGSTLFIGGQTGAATGPGADSATGRGRLVVENTGTSYAAGGVLSSASAAADTVLGPSGANRLDIQLNGPERTVSLNGGAAVAFTAADTDLQLTGPGGEVVHVDLSGVPGGFTGPIDIAATGRLSVDEGASWTPIDYSTTQRLSDSRTGAVTGVDSSNIRRTGVEQIEYPGTSNAFTALLQLRDDLQNHRGLNEQQLQEALTRHIGELDRSREQLLDSVGELSLEAANLGRRSGSRRRPAVGDPALARHNRECGPGRSGHGTGGYAESAAVHLRLVGEIVELEFARLSVRSHDQVAQLDRETDRTIGPHGKGVPTMSDDRNQAAPQRGPEREETRDSGARQTEIAALLPLLQAQDVDLASLARLVKETDAVSNQVLREANSASAGVRRRVETVEHATVMVGARRIHQLAVRRLREMRAPVEQLLRTPNTDRVDSPHTESTQS